MKSIKYPIGIQTFSEIISEGYLYVDKTALIYELVTKNKYVFLSRPRRFGKSLLMSTLEAYFKGEKHLFKGLQISELETQWKEYTVLRFDLSGGPFNTPDQLEQHIDSYLREYENIYNVNVEGNVSVKFRELIREIYHKTGKKIVILIDEYDKPMLDCLHDDNKHEAIKDVLRGFYSMIKASDEYLKFAMITGITKFGKVSVFSGMNNLKDISLLPNYNTICGISESEFHRDFKTSISNYSIEHDIDESEAWELFRNMYDGYLFAAKGEGIYNPFSVLNAFDDKELNSYWYETGSSSYLIRLIEKNNYRLDRLDGERRSKVVLKDISDVKRDFVPLLFQSGYLTIKNYDPITEEYTLGFPNKEVNKAFWTSLANHFFRGIGGESVFNVGDFVKDIYNGNAERFMLRLKSLFSDTESELEKNKEIHFQNIMAIASKMVGLFVRTEVRSSMGRCDMQILSPRYVYIFEFKIDGSPNEALEQIHEKHYYGPFAIDERTKILIGANFSTKTRTLEDWIIETLE